MELNALEKSMNRSVALSFFARTLSMIRWIVWIYDAVNQTILKYSSSIYSTKVSQMDLYHPPEENKEFWGYRDKNYFTGDI